MRQPPCSIRYSAVRPWIDDQEEARNRSALPVGLTLAITVHVLALSLPLIAPTTLPPRVIDLCPFFAISEAPSVVAHTRHYFVTPHEENRMRGAQSSYVLLWLALGGSACGLASDELATFTRTDDPERVVLLVQSERPGAGVRDTMTLYGDGRLALARHQDGKAQRREGRLEPFELDELLRQVVADRLAEFDPISIRAREVDKNGGFRPTSSSGPLVKVLISLDSLSRGGRPAQKVERQVDFMSPQLAAERFPEIREYQGLVRLLDYMRRAFDRFGDDAEP